ncbi:glucans biosynthesis glucosyltransferase MdoH [Sphingobium aquiterrae]|uniref:glucans biosynthesis glucosyltransferase MdoH n=1 Tax=Sphingobium aquiterrae TaxID=2038656 RepID=UPI00301805A9
MAEQRAARQARLSPSQTPPFDNLPPDAPIAMPIQDFARQPLMGRMRAVQPVDYHMVARRILVVAMSAVPAWIAMREMQRTIGMDGLSGWEVLYLLLFIPLFAWIAFGFSTGLLGFLVTTVREQKIMRRLDAMPAQPPRGRTAILLPVCNEDFLGVLGRLSIMERSLARTMGADRFDVFILSDSSAENGVMEAQTYSQMRRSFTLPVYYRRRAENIGRKPGNIAEWVRRQGGGYDYMIVLDADSLMSGQTMTRLAADMERHPHVALIQTIPSVAGASTLFARWQQFAGRLYGPISAIGMIWWSGSEGMFWGHNAIVRVSAFAESCGLPELPGRAPFGGHIMSHDMIEAALLRRSGWSCHMVMADDSFEEFPPSLPDLAIRDRRWCQGNMQHVPLLKNIVGLHPVSRFQLLVGASAYATSPLWLAMILLIMAGEFAGAWTTVAMLPSGSLLALTAVLLFGPKLMGIAWALWAPERREGFGGTMSILRGATADIILSILMAPISMLTQTINLAGILAGRKSAWNGQTRDRDGIALRDAFRLFRPHVVLGAAMVVAAIASGISMIWLSPIFVGLLMAPFVASLTARKDLGRVAAAHGVFEVRDPWWRQVRVTELARPAPILRGRELAIPARPLALAANDGW